MCFPCVRLFFKVNFRRSMIASAQGLRTGKLILDKMIKSGICHIRGYNIHHVPDIAKNCQRIFLSALQFKPQLCHRDLGHLRSRRLTFSTLQCILKTCCCSTSRKNQADVNKYIFKLRFCMEEQLLLCTHATDKHRL